MIHQFADIQSALREPYHLLTPWFPLRPLVLSQLNGFLVPQLVLLYYPGG